MKGYMELKSLTMDELTGVVNLYPWFGGARKELFMRLLAHGDDAASGTAFSDAAMYVSSRRLLSKAFRRQMDIAVQPASGAALDDVDFDDDEEAAPESGQNKSDSASDGEAAHTEDSDGSTD